MEAIACDGENDWDEYEDEIASAVAFASWQESSANGWDWGEDEAETAAELGEAHGPVEHQEGWAAVDEAEDDDDASYQWSDEK